MTEEKKIDFQIFTDGRGEYVFILEKNRYTFTFPINSTLANNLEAICKLKETIVAKINSLAEEEIKKAEEPKVEVVNDPA